MELRFKRIAENLSQHTVKSPTTIPLVSLPEHLTMGKEDGFVEGKIEGKTEQCVETILMLINEKGFDRKTAIELANVPNECREEVFFQLNTIIGC